MEHSVYESLFQQLRIQHLDEMLREAEEDRRARRFRHRPYLRSLIGRLLIAAGDALVALGLAVRDGRVPAASDIEGISI